MADELVDPDPNGDILAARLLSSLREATGPVAGVQWWYLDREVQEELYQLVDRATGERLGWFLGKAKARAYADAAGLENWQVKTRDGLLVMYHDPRHDEPGLRARAEAHDESVAIAKRLFG